MQTEYVQSLRDIICERVSKKLGLEQLGQAFLIMFAQFR